MQYGPHNKERGIISLVVTLVVSLFAVASSLALASGSLGELVKNKNTNEGGQVFYAAESSMKEATHQYLSAIANASEYSEGLPVLLNDTTAGSLNVIPQEWPYVKVRGSAENYSVHRAVSQIVTVFPSGLAFDYAVYSSSGLVFEGNAAVNGNVFSNESIDFSGSAEINGDAFSPGPIGDNGNINGEIIEDVDTIPPPTINAEPYRQEALVQGTSFVAAADAAEYLNNEIRNAVVFVDDPVNKTKIQGTNTDLTGSIVTLGDLEISGGTYTPTGHHAVLVVYGDLKISGGAEINGVVYVKGSTSFGSGNNVINGSMISAGSIGQTDITGNAVINFDPVAAAEWREIDGLDRDTDEAPRVIDWTEE